jgi:hypothetical protein
MTVSAQLLSPPLAFRPQARAWLYVLALNGPEDLIKVGLTNDPVSRWSALHARWYEAFDLANSMLVACESRKDAQALETALHRELVEHSCPMPLAIRGAAAGCTEWYRGAYPRARRYVDSCEGQGYSVLRSAFDHVAHEMKSAAYRLEELLQLAHRDLLDGMLGEAQRRALVDLVDGHRAFDSSLDDRLPQDAWRSVRRLGH